MRKKVIQVPEHVWRDLHVLRVETGRRALWEVIEDLLRRCRS